MLPLLTPAAALRAGRSVRHKTETVQAAQPGDHYPSSVATSGGSGVPVNVSSTDFTSIEIKKPFITTAFPDDRSPVSQTGSCGSSGIATEYSPGGILDVTMDPFHFLHNRKQA